MTHNKSPRRGADIFCPHRRARSVTEIDPQELIALGMKGVILDLDNTLAEWHKEEIALHILEWVQSLQDAGLKLCLLSNSIWSKRSERVAARLGFPNVRQAKKPSKGGFHRALHAMGTEAHHTAMVGDQMFTDILGGNRMGIYTIMVEPIHPHEFAYTKYISRPPERMLLRYFRKKGRI